MHLATQPDIDTKKLLAQAYKELKKLRREKTASHDNSFRPIAVIGMRCRFPKSPNPEAFWDLLQSGEDGVGEVPPSRWSLDQHYDPRPEVPNKSYSKWGGFIEGIEWFDAQFFDISPREALTMDPQQRLVLEMAWETFESAGYTKDALSHSKTGVFIGCSFNGYHDLIKPHLDPQDHTSSLGNQNAIIPNRVSFFFNLKGPSVLVDTMCSSSLVALHSACQSLQAGDCNMALAGGVNLLLSPEYYTDMSKMKIHSPDGRCKSFDHRANGIVLGEGIGSVLLKPLEEALKDKDNIMGVIRGSAINHGGMANGLTAPNPSAHADLIGKALQSAELSAEDISYVEAHGTGTALGDPIEIEGLTQAFRRSTKRRQFCQLGSVKSNIGHLEAAAGISQFIKVILSMKHAQLPPMLHFEKGNPIINFKDSPFTLNTTLSPWQSSGPRRAGISSFGIGGTNVHLIAEEAPQQTETKAAKELPFHLLNLSAKSKEALHEMIRRYFHFLEASPSTSMADMCYTANVCKTHFRERKSFLFSNGEELMRLLKAEMEQTDTHVPGQSMAASPKPAFLFTGQGAQYPKMCLELYQNFPVFEQAIDECEQIADTLWEYSLREILFESETETLNNTVFTQPALFAVAYGLSKLWQSFGLRPALGIGHSVGEYALACIAGVFSLKDGLRLIIERGRLMQQLPQTGAMMAVAVDQKTIETYLQHEEYIELNIAAYNGPESIVLSGDTKALNLLSQQLKAANIRVKMLAVSHAFHSPMMDPILDTFRSIAEEVDYRQPSFPIVSTLTGNIVAEEMATAAYWVRHITQPVRFEAAIMKAVKEKASHFIEIGPHPNLTAMAKAFLSDEDMLEWTPSCRKNQHDYHTMLQALSDVYTAGHSINWAALYPSDQYAKIPLPLYPFQKEKYWVEPSQKSNGAHQNSTSSTSLLGHRLVATACSTDEIWWQNTLSVQSHSFFQGHRVGGEMVMPFSLYIEMIHAAMKEVKSEQPFKVEAMNFLQSLVMPEDGALLLQTVLKFTSDTHLAFEIYSRVDHPQEHMEWTLNAKAEVEMMCVIETEASLI
jgi:acyl transferase domain-containing protein